MLMKSLRAFVGHSFTIDDEEVVGQFLRYLDAIQDINAEFAWEHAEHPEPSAIDEKVLRLFENKNLFIGICTRKELVLQPTQLNEIWLFASRRSVRTADLVWKTSDWVIQEIGLAFGRGLKVILLLEDGVRLPGGIQGSLEYIPFCRETPEKAFGRLLQMVASLSPTEAVVVEIEPSLTSPPAGPKKSATETDWLTPNHTWRCDNYKHAFMHLSAIGDVAGAADIGDAFLQSSFATSSPEVDSWNAFRGYIRILFGKEGRLEDIKELANNAPPNADVLRYLALSYKTLGEELLAARTFVSAADAETEKTQKIALFGEAVETAIQKYPSLAEQALNKAKEIAIGDPALSSSLLAIESAFSKARGEKGFMFASLERLLEVTPDDHSRRFDLAYAYADAGLDDMALYHYQRVPYGARTDALWNNLGVSYASQKLPIKSVFSYKKARELGSTLAMSNLAHGYMQAGFLDEAREVCEEAARTPDHHKNVDSALTKAKEVLDSEEELEKKLISSAQDFSDFNRKAGAAMIDTVGVEVIGQWLYEGVCLSVTVTKGEFRAQGSGEEKVPVLRRFPGTDETPEPFEIIITGQLRGRAVQGTYEKKRKRSLQALSLLGTDEREDLLLYFSEDGGSIEVLRGRAGEKRKRSVMKRLASSAQRQDDVQRDTLGAA
jgi:tetratricopeptide (TPR) repeat protein